MELIGIPHRLVISDKGLDAQTIEYRARTESESVDLPLAGIVDFIKAKLA
jgi:prolyl-tRNA synthetase